MAYDTRGMVSVDKMLPSENKVYRTNIGCVMYTGNGAWEGYNDIRVFPTHWMPEGINGMAVEVTDRNRQEIHVWLNYRSQEHYYTNTMVTRKSKWYLFIDDGRLKIMPLPKGVRNIVSLEEFKDCFLGYKKNKFFTGGMNKDLEPSFLKNNYFVGIDPADGLKDTSNVAIRYADGKIERFLPEDKQKAHDDVEAYFKCDAPAIRDERLLDEMVRISKYYNCTVKEEKFPRGVVLEGFVDWEIKIRIDDIRRKSELNVIKYRRK